MNRTLVKICGITSVHDALLAARLGQRWNIAGCNWPYMIRQRTVHRPTSQPAWTTNWEFTRPPHRRAVEPRAE